MKNAVISALLTYIFYTDFCEVKLVWTIPIIFCLILFILVWIEEDFVKDYLRHKQRGQRLIRRMRGGLRPEKHDDDTVDFLHHWADNAERY